MWESRIYLSRTECETWSWMWNFLPKSRYPQVNNHPLGDQEENAIGSYTTYDHHVIQWYWVIIIYNDSNILRIHFWKKTEKCTHM